MAYKTYITEALVCGSHDSNTSDRSYLLFSRDAGMVWASARSVREERSKQRYALQDFSYSRLTLIRGKSGWRVAGAEPIENIYLRAHERERRAMVMRVVHLLRRVMRGDTPHEQIFDDVMNACTNENIKDIKKMEHVVFLRVLHELGYIAKIEPYAELLNTPRMDEKIEMLTDSETARIVEAVERGLAESHL